MELAMQRAQVRVVVAWRKEKEKAKGKEGASSSAPKAVDKGVPKRKADEKDDYLSKKVSVTPEEKPPKKPSPLKAKHGVGKGLMTTLGPITQEPDCRLLIHKGYAIKMMESIINDKDVDPCAKQAMEVLGASGLFDIAQVRFFLSFSHSSFLCLIADSCSVL